MKTSVYAVLLAVPLLAVTTNEAVSQCKDRATGISCEPKVVSVNGQNVEAAEAQVVKHSSGVVAVVLVTASDQRLNVDDYAWARVGSKSYMVQAETSVRQADPNYVVEETVIILNAAAAAAQSHSNFVLWLRQDGVQFDLSPVVQDIRQVTK